MNHKPLSQAKDPDVRNIMAAAQRAAQRARDVAKQTNTPLVVQRNGKMMLVKVE
jgi:hypothetical protein